MNKLPYEKAETEIVEINATAMMDGSGGGTVGTNDPCEDPCT